MNDLSTSRRATFLAGIFLIVALRVFLVADRDIVATFSPYDEYWHVDAALRRIIGGQYNHMVFAHLPIYAIWLMLLSDIGIPARIGIDIFWLIGSGYLAFSISNLSKRVWTGILTFILLAYHPYSLVLFDRALAETFLAAISVLVLAAALEIWNTREEVAGKLRRRIALLIFCIGFAIAYHTRKEGFLLLLPIIAMAFHSWVGRKNWWSRGRRGYLSIPLIVAPIITTLALGIFLASVNYFRWGGFARYELASPQYVRAIDAIIAIDSGRTSPRHVTVTAATRDIAYHASPTFAQLRPYFDGGVGQNLARMTTAMDQSVSGEIGDWVFYWAVRDAAASAGWHSSAGNAEIKYRAIANELENSFAGGSIKRRPVFASFVDPDWKKWIGHLPMSVLGELKLVLSPSLTPANLDRPLENATSKQFADYSLLLGRRRVPQNSEMIGWVIAPKNSLVGFGGEQGGSAWSLLDAPVRADVVGAIPFSIRGSNGGRPSVLYVRLVNGKVGQLDLAGLGVGQIRDLNGLEGVRVGIEHLYLPTVIGQTPRLERLSSYIDSSKPDALLEIISKGWSLIGWGLLALTLAAIFIAGLKRVVADKLVVVGLVSLVVFSRAVLFGILDASAWYGQVSRYMFPAEPFFIAGVVLGAGSLFELIRAKN